MADESKDQVEGAAEGGSGKKKMLFAGGGGGALLALAFLFAMLGVPSKNQAKSFKGPFVAALTAEKVQVNLIDSKSYLIFDLNVVYEAYEETYFTARSEDPLTIAEIRDVLVALASSKSRDDVSDKINKPIFMEEIRVAIEPLLFPVLVGDAKRPYDADSSSGLAFGYSSHLTTFRGPFEDHVIHLDADDQTIQLDDGPLQEWSFEDDDYELLTANGSVIYFDLTGVDPAFAGEVKIGVMGHPRRVLWKEILIQ